MRARKYPSVQTPITIDPSQAGLTLKQAAVYLGISPWQARMMIWEGRLPAKKIGKALIVSRADADKFLAELPPVPPNPASWLANRSSGKAAA